MKAKETKNYTIKVADGRFTLQMTKKSPDGRFHSVSVPYPLVMAVDGIKKKLTRKQTEAYCLDQLRSENALV